MYKLIVIIAAAMPIILLLRAIFVGRSQKASRAFSEFKKQIDYLVWVNLVRYRLCFRLFSRKPDPLHVEMTLPQFHHRKKAANVAPRPKKLNSSSYWLD